MPKIKEDYEEMEEISEDEMDEELAKPKRKLSPKKVEVPKKPKTRYVAFMQQQREGIMDSETNEVVSETIWEALANIMERLEKIEDQIGGL